MNFKKASVLFLLFVFALSFQNLNAQKRKFKFGKISEEELNLKIYEKDSSANAVILFDVGKSTIEGYYLVFSRHIRVKILNKEGVDEGNFHLELYSKGGDTEQIYALKGKTFNVENGELVSTKLSASSNVLEEKVNKNLVMKKINFPAVKEGSIIDLYYSIKSDFLFNLQDWQFQYDIPVLYSKYTTVIPEFFDYHRNLRGYYSLNISEKSETRTIANSIYSSTNTTWTASDIPAFEKEPYITTVSDYISVLEFELESFQIPGQSYQNFSQKWSQIDKHLYESSYFGKMMEVNTQIQTLADGICKDTESLTEKMLKLYTYVQKGYNWNKRYSEYTDKKLNKLMSDKSGNCADLNFLLLRLLKSQGINASPTILSTRGNGKIFPTHPSLTAFNYMVVYVKIDDKEHFLDATDDETPMGVLPYRCLNLYGRTLQNKGSMAININAPVKYSKSKMYTVKIIEEEDYECSVNLTYNGYAAINKRKEVKNEGGIDQYIKKKNEESKFSTLTNFKINDFENIYKPYQETFDFSSNDNVVFAGNMIYIDPFLHEKIEKSPFTLEDRKYPVDYGYLTSETLIFQYQIPEGYTVSEVPKNISMALAQRAASYKFQVSVIGQNVQVMSQLKINKPIFLNDSYSALRNFYNLMIEKQNEKIVLKKNE